MTAAGKSRRIRLPLSPTRTVAATIGGGTRDSRVAEPALRVPVTGPSRGGRTARARPGRAALPDARARLDGTDSESAWHESRPPRPDDSDQLGVGMTRTAAASAGDTQ